MASPYDPNAGRNVAVGVGGQNMKGQAQRLGRLGLSPRQQEMNWLWSYYMCAQYAERVWQWDGSRRMEKLEKAAISSGYHMPQGFQDQSGQGIPLEFRRPSAPYHLCKVIVDRFTSLLFSQKRHPTVDVEGDPDSEDFLNAVAETGRLWPTMLQARMFGGACGSVAVGFQFLKGKPYFEVHDPRWVFPHFKDRATLELSQLEKRYIFFQEKYDPEEEAWVEVPYWYRRLITDRSDVVFHPEPVGDGREPKWQVMRGVNHNFGFCPVQWIQNIPVVGDIDGLPDCHGTYEKMESIDRLLSQAERGIIANCDPTLILTTEADMGSIKKGSENAIKVPSGDAKYLEISGTGPASARELAAEHRARVLEIAQCFLEGEATVAKTATEIERHYSSMLSKADILREQYGERGVKPLLEKVAAAVRQITTPQMGEDGVSTTRQVILLPPKIVEEDSLVPGAPKIIREVPRKLGTRQWLDPKLRWPRYFEPGLQDAMNAVTAASGAKAASLVDDEHASKMVSEYFGVEDLPKMMEELNSKDESMMKLALGGMIGGGEPREDVSADPALEDEPEDDEDDF